MVGSSSISHAIRTLLGTQVLSSLQKGSVMEGRLGREEGGGGLDDDKLPPTTIETQRSRESKGEKLDRNRGARPHGPPKEPHPRYGNGLHQRAPPLPVHANHPASGCGRRR